MKRDALVRRVSATTVLVLLVILGGNARAGLPDDAPPAAPTNVSASQGLYANKVVVAYDTVAGATSYEIRRVPAGRKPVSPIATDDDGHWEDTVAEAGVHYLYWVDACNAAECSNTALSVQGYAAENPLPPTNLVATDGTFSTHVRVIYWPWQYENVAYNIYRQTHAAYDANKPPIATGVVDTTFDDHTAAPGQVYWYWASTVNVVGESAVSDSDSGHRGALVSPTPGPSSTPWPSATPTWTRTPWPSPTPSRTRTPGPSPTPAAVLWLPIVVD